jgi:hypothetical protein
MSYAIGIAILTFLIHPSHVALETSPRAPHAVEKRIQSVTYLKQKRRIESINVSLSLSLSFSRGRRVPLAFSEGSEVYRLYRESERRLGLLARD